ncbi:amino acid adenylation domain-containing protein [Micromonospora sp. NPDC047074]|uniref:non-ribosomal peptide synthetase n=1 Tax=Micromonospora sp. NPDC047074 TaxID=3154339 RepID=UPI0033FCC085
MIPLSHAQQRLWFLDRLHGFDPTYHLPVVLRLQGPLDRTALAAAVGDVVARHESLRTVFPDTDGVPHQKVLAAAAAGPELTVTACPAAELDARIQAAASAPFSLAQAPPLRADLFVCSAAESVLLLTLHHIIADGWSIGVLLRDLAAAYRTRSAGLGAPGWAELPVQYTDYTLWQRELLGDRGDPESIAGRQLAYWRDALEGVPAALPLPADRPRPSAAGQRGAGIAIDWDASRHRELSNLARRHNCTVFMVVQAALCGLLCRMGAGTDIPLGSVTAGRTDEALDDLVGLFVNTLVLRTDLSGDPSFTELLRRVRDVDLQAYAHQDLPFDLLVEELNPPRSADGHPFFQVMLAFETRVEQELDFGSVRVSRPEVDIPAAKAELNLQLTEHVDAAGGLKGISGVLEYATDVFRRGTAQLLADRLSRFLDAAVAAPEMPISELTLLTPDEREQILRTWNDTTRQLPVTTLPEAFRRQTALTPHATALIWGSSSLTYAELDLETDRLARGLRQLGAGPGAVVAVALPRSAELVVSLLAVVKAGGAYLPLDPGYPDERIRMMLHDARPVCVLSDPELRTRLADGEFCVATPGELMADAATGVADPLRTGPVLRPQHPAYVIYTSGSTGRPKGVVVSHAAIDNRLRWMQAAYPLTPDDRILQKTPSGFDVSVWEFFWPMQVGAALVLAGPDEHRDPAALVRTIVAHRVTTVHFVPSMLNLFITGPTAARCGGLRRVFCSGEALPRDTATAFHQILPGVALTNLYGPTEAAVDVTCHDCVPGEQGPVPIGRPVWNTQVRVLDDRLAPCPAGLAGELYISGVQLADGYLARAALTSTRFVADPYGPPGSRMYRTGDRVRWTPEGELVYLGRTDDQVKLRGQRIEPGEVEAALLAEETVAAACVVVREDTPGDQRLVAYVTPAAAGPQVRASVDPQALLGNLADVLPGALVPTAVVVLDTLPLSPNGKLDRRALPPPPVSVAQGREPRSRLERTLVRLYAELLGVADVGVEDDFFQLGGHSMLAVRLARRIHTELAVTVPVQSIFRHPTPAALARQLPRTGATEEAFGPVLELRSEGAGEPLFLVHPGTGLSWCYFRLLEHLDPARPVHALQARGFAETAAGGVLPALPRTVAEMAADYLTQVRKIQPTGPYHLAGWSFGGLVAHSMATRLEREGEQVASLVVLDGYPEVPGQETAGRLLGEALHNLLGVPPGDAAGDAQDPGELVASVLDEVRRRFPPLADADDDGLHAALRIGMNNLRLQYGFVPELLQSDMTLVVARSGDPSEWQRYVAGRLTVLHLDAEHHDLCSAAAEDSGRLLAGVLAKTGAAAGQGSEK